MKGLLFLQICIFTSIFVMVRGCNEMDPGKTLLDICNTWWKEAENIYIPHHTTANCILMINRFCPTLIDVEFISETKTPNMHHGTSEITKLATLKDSKRLINKIRFTETKKIELCEDSEGVECDFWWATVEASLVSHKKKEACIELIYKHCPDLIKEKNTADSSKTVTYVYKDQEKALAYHRNKPRN